MMLSAEGTKLLKYVRVTTQNVLKLFEGQVGAG